MATAGAAFAHTHVKDERGIAPDHEFLIPGEGEMDYPGLSDGSCGMPATTGISWWRSASWCKAVPDSTAGRGDAKSMTCFRGHSQRGYRTESYMIDQDRRAISMSSHSVRSWRKSRRPDNRTRVTEAQSLVMVQAGSATTFALAFQRLGGKLGIHLSLRAGRGGRVDSRHAGSRRCRHVRGAGGAGSTDADLAGERRCDGKQDLRLLPFSRVQRAARHAAIG